MLIRKLNWFTHDKPKQEKDKGAGKKKTSNEEKRIGTTSLKQQGGCYSATDKLTMGRSEASSVHI